MNASTTAGYGVFLVVLGSLGAGGEDSRMVRDGRSESAPGLTEALSRSTPVDVEPVAGRPVPKPASAASGEPGEDADGIMAEVLKFAWDQGLEGAPGRAKVKKALADGTKILEEAKRLRKISKFSDKDAAELSGTFLYFSRTIANKAPGLTRTSMVPLLLIVMEALADKGIIDSANPYIGGSSFPFLALADALQDHYNAALRDPEAREAYVMRVEELAAKLEDLRAKSSE